MRHFNDEMLFSRFTADGTTMHLIQDWMENIQMHYDARYRCFARILEATGMTGPFNLTSDGKPRSDAFICEYSKKDKRTCVSVFLRFCDVFDNPGEIWIDDHECKNRKIFTLKNGKIVPRDN